MTKKTIGIIFLVTLALFAFYFCYIIAKPFLQPIITALVLAIAFHPVHIRVHKRVRNANLAALISTLLVILVIIVPTVLLGVAITRELTDTYKALSERSAEEGGWTPFIMHLLERPLAWVGKYVDLSEFNLRDALLSRLREISGFLVNFARGMVGNVTSLILNSVIAFFTLFFLFREGDHTRRRLAATIPLTHEQIEKLFADISRTITASIYGSLAVAIAQGSLTGVAFWVLGLPSPILWGVVTAIFSLIPMVGSGIVWLPAAILLILSGSYGKGIFLIIFGAAVIGTVDNIIRPYVMSGQADLPTLLLFFALFGGVQEFGIIGLFVGPIVLAISISVWKMLRDEMKIWNASLHEHKVENST
ncbi:MAG: AI-2E family transporter [Acidobacteriota bacterium]